MFIFAVLSIECPNNPVNVTRREDKVFRHMRRGMVELTSRGTGETVELEPGDAIDHIKGLSREE